VHPVSSTRSGAWPDSVERMTLRHIVSWKLAETDPELNRQQRRAIADALETLPPLIPEILRLEVGINVRESESAHDVVLVADYADEAALDAYTVHPEHEKVAAFVRSLVAARTSVDYIV
jgi:DsbC/DsbD-like thiol-disulfide interchange protein